VTDILLTGFVLQSSEELFLTNVHKSVYELTPIITVIAHICATLHLISSSYSAQFSAFLCDFNNLMLRSLHK